MFAQLAREVARCTACPAMAHSHVLSRRNGPLDARVLFVAEAVGRRGGAITGQPLTRDESGKRFAAFLEIAQLARDEVFITNAALCNPLDARGCNRAPTALEVARCRPFLARTLEAVTSPVVVALGRVALESLCDLAPHDATLRTHAGQAVVWGDRLLVPLYHPSRQSTLHRTQQEQEQDWRRLGAICAKCEGGADSVATGPSADA